MLYKRTLAPARNIRFSLRTLCVLTIGVAVVCALFQAPPRPPWLAHLILVCAMAAPGMSLGFDVAGWRGAARGTIAAAVGGTILISAIVLAAEFIAF